MPNVEYLSNPPSGRYGQQVNVIKGGYVENDGAWIDLQRGNKGYTKKMVYLMILQGDGTLLSTAILQTSVVMKNLSPETKEEAVLELHAEIRSKMEELTKLIAHCRLSESNVNGMAQIFKKKIVEASRRLVAKKNCWYLHTEWEDDMIDI